MFEAGQLIKGQYQVLATHSGGMAVVYIARDRNTEKVFAIKSPRPDKTADASLIARFRRESRMWVNLDHHAHIVQAFIYDEIDGTPYLFLEYIDGVELQAFLKRDRPIYPQQAVRWAAQVAGAMGYVHNKTIGKDLVGLLHRDLKPANIMVDREGRLKITDFGLGRLSVDSSLSITGGFLGTPLYSSPEQIEGKPLDNRTDIYSFGVILYELLVGRLPFEAKTFESLLGKVLLEPPIPPGDAVPGIPGELNALVVSCLEKDRDDRPGSFGVIADTLEKIGAAMGDEASLPGPFTRCDCCGIVLSGNDVSCPLEKLEAAPSGPLPALLDDGGEDDGTLHLSDFEMQSTTDLLGVAPAPRGASLAVKHFRVWPSRPRAGDLVQVEVMVENKGGADAVDAVLEFAVPHKEGFSRVGEPEAWRGNIAAGGEVLIGYAFKALQEGTFPPVRIELSWGNGGGDGKRLLCGTIPPLNVLCRPDIPLVGRERAIHTVDKLLDGAQKGQANVFMLYGEEGTGKTRLVERIESIARERGFLVAQGSADKRGVEPLKAFIAVLRCHLCMAELVLTEAEIGTLVARAFGSGERDDPLCNFVMEALSGFPALMDSVAAGQSAVPGLERLQPPQWLKAILRMASDRPLLVVLEDMHLAAPQDLALLDYLAARAREAGAGILFCVTYRNSPNPSYATEVQHGLAELGRSGMSASSLFFSCRLKPFEREETDHAIKALFPDGELPERFPWFAETVQNATGGNPRLMVALLRDLQEREGRDRKYTVNQSEGTWELGEGITPQWLRQHVPFQVEALIRTQTRHLTDDTLKLLETAAVMGQDFDVPILEKVLSGMDAEAVEEGLDILEANGFIKPLDPRLTRYRFVYALFRDAIEQQFQARYRRRALRLHGEIADAMQALLSGGALDERKIDLARHRIAAGEPAPGLGLLLEGIEHLLREEHFYQCAEPIESAKQLAASLPDVDDGIRHRLTWMEAEYRRSVGHVEPALALYQEYIKAKERIGDRSSLCDGWLKTGEVLFRLGRRAEAEDSFQKVLLHAKESDNPKALARAYNSLGLIAKNRRDYDRARECLVQAKALYEEAEDREGAVAVLVNLGNVLRFQKDYDGCFKVLDEAVGLAKETKIHHLQAGVILSLANLHCRKNELDRAEDRYKEVLGHYRHMGDRLMESAALGNLASVMCLNGKAGEAVNHYRESLRLRRLTGNKPGGFRILVELVDLLLFMGRREAAAEEAEKALTLARGMNNRDEQILSLALLAKALRQEAPGKAKAHLLEALQLAKGEEVDLSVYGLAVAELVTPDLPAVRFLMAEEEVGKHVREGLALSGQAVQLEVALRFQAVDALLAARSGLRKKAEEDVNAALERLAGATRPIMLDPALFVLLVTAGTVGSTDLEEKLLAAARDIVPAPLQRTAQAGFWPYVRA